MIKIKYPTQIKQIKIGGKLFIMEVIRDLDEAIDLICSAMTSEEQKDPFAEDLCPYFGLLWPSAQGLAQHLADGPSLVKDKKVIELGAGPGLPSLVTQYLGGKALATDFHPDAEEYFLRNCRHSSLSCSYRRLNWRDDSSKEDVYDVVLGSDILYEPKHPQEVALGLLRFVKPQGKIILSDPGRNYLQKFLDAMRELGHQENITAVSVDGKEIFIIEYTV